MWWIFIDEIALSAIVVATLIVGLCRSGVWQRDFTDVKKDSTPTVDPVRSEPPKSKPIRYGFGKDVFQHKPRKSK